MPVPHPEMVVLEFLAFQQGLQQLRVEYLLLEDQGEGAIVVGSECLQIKLTCMLVVEQFQLYDTKPQFLTVSLSLLSILLNARHQSWFLNGK